MFTYICHAVFIKNKANMYLCMISNDYAYLDKQIKKRIIVEQYLPII